MKKTLWTASVLLACLVFGGMAFAQQKDSNKPAAPVTQTAAHASKPAAMAMHTISGKVVSVNAVANTIVIKTKQGEKTYNVEPAAKINVGKENKLADLKAGSNVKVSYKMEGEQRIATHIW